MTAFSWSFCRHLLVGEKREGTKVLMSPQNLPTPRNQPTCSALISTSTQNIKTSKSPHSPYPSQPVFDLDGMANGKALSTDCFFKNFCVHSHGMQEALELNALSILLPLFCQFKVINLQLLYTSLTSDKSFPRKQSIVIAAIPQP